MIQRNPVAQVESVKRDSDGYDTCCTDKKQERFVERVLDAVFGR